MEKDGDQNAGVLDQRFALEWVQKYIHLFGGSPDHVTLLGESGGGGFILLHTTAGLGKKVPFAQAIPQSPAMVVTFQQANTTVSDFMASLKVSTLAELRNVSEADIIAANAAQIAAAAPNSFLWGPVVDQKSIPAPYLKLIKDGKFDKSVKLLLGHNSFEGSFFFDPTVKTEADFRKWAQLSLTINSESALDYLVTKLYPPNFDGSLGYVDQDSRQIAFWGEAGINCNWLMTNVAQSGHSFACEWTFLSFLLRSAAMTDVT